MRGRFITIEGIEGVGKTSNIQFIEDFLRGRGIDLVSTREPGGTEIGEQIRTILLDTRNKQLAPLSELLLVFAARAQHLEELIIPTLESGCWVLCDRFTDATRAYQGSGRGLDTGAIDVLQTLVQHTLQPDLTLVLDIEPRLGLARARGRGELDRFEQEDIVFFERVRAGYLALAAREPERFRVVDASAELSTVAEEVSSVLADFIDRGQ